MTENRHAMILPASSGSIPIKLVSRFFYARREMTKRTFSIYAKLISLVYILAGDRRKVYRLHRDLKSVYILLGSY